MALSRCSIIFALMIVWSTKGLSQLSSPADSLFYKLQNHPKKDTIRISLLNQLAYELYLSNPEQSLHYAYEAIALSNEIGFPKGHGQALRQIGLVSWSQSNFGMAMKSFIAGLSVAERYNDAQTIADLTGNVGLVYLAVGEPKEALKFHERSLQMQRSLKNEMRESVALNNMGDVLLALASYDDAIEYYKKALQIRKRYGYLNGIATNIRNIGKVFETRGHNDEALKQYLTSLQISDSLHDKRGMSQSLHSVASIYYKTKRYSLAEQYEKESLKISLQSNYRAFIRDSYLLLSNIAEATQKPSQALELFKLSSNYKDSVINLQLGSEVLSYRLDYETQKKETEINLLRKDVLLQEAAISKKNILITSIIISLLLLIFMTGLILRNFRKQKLVNQLLEIKNKEIEENRSEISQQRDELMALNEEIRAQQEEVIASRDALEERNISIAEMNEKILTINETLEKLVAERTFALEKQNQQLIEYAFVNAHKLRAPVARVIGLATLISYTKPNEEQQALIELLNQSTTELDEITKSITLIVQKGLDAYDQNP